LLKVENLSLCLSTNRSLIKIINDVDFSINKNEIFALVGESGSGKSMTANCITRLLPENAKFVEGSKILFQDRDILLNSDAKMRNIRGRDIGMIFQEPMSALNPVLSIKNQLMEALKTSKQMTKGFSLQQQCIELLEKVRIPSAKSRLNHYPHQLSGGMRQRVIIAIALAGNPKLLIADEPTTALDVTVEADILKLLKTIQSEHDLSILLISHDLAVVSQIADRVSVMYAGEIIEEAQTNAFFNNPLHPYSQKLIKARPNNKNRNQKLITIPGTVPNFNDLPTGCNFYSRCEHHVNICKQPQKILNTQSSEPHKVRCHRWGKLLPLENNIKNDALPNKIASKNNLMNVSNLSVWFPINKRLIKRSKQYIKALNNVSFSITQGETIAVVGESGCGKSTLAKAMLGLIQPTTGNIRLNTKLNTERTSIYNIIQMVFQDPFSSMNPKMMVKDILLEGIKALNLMKKSQQEQEAQRLISLVGLPYNSLERYPHEFSGGQKQRIAIARALSVKPQLIICDEPTSALDVPVQAQILNLLKRLQTEHNLSYLFISHDLSVVSYLADKIAVMYLGEIVELGSQEEVLNNPKHPYTYSLIQSAPDINKPLNKTILSSDLPSQITIPSGCPYHPRCNKAEEKCKFEKPELVKNSHSYSCHYPIS
jgi:peptide/nickel transport system ATP-binding protein